MAWNNRVASFASDAPTGFDFVLITRVLFVIRANCQTFNAGKEILCYSSKPRPDPLRPHGSCPHRT